MKLNEHFHEIIVILQLFIIFKIVLPIIKNDKIILFTVFTLQQRPITRRAPNLHHKVPTNCFIFFFKCQNIQNNICGISKVIAKQSKPMEQILGTDDLMQS